MKRRPEISTRRAVEIYREMVSARRCLYDDNEFFKMPDAWDAMREGNESWKTNTYRTDQIEDYKRKAGIVALGDFVTLSADERLIENARNGCKFSNFVLAHEIGHLALEHHAKSATTKNFQLTAAPNGMINSPPNMEELEANLAAVFFQCGVALEDRQMPAIELAHRACSDVYYVRKAQRFVQLDVFQRELIRQRTRYERVIM